jgi:L-cysteine desulfidase
MTRQTTDEQIIQLIKREVVPALGCTEPIAIALAASKASELLGSAPDKIELWVSSNILKNAMAVGIPGTGMNGIPIAAALGALAGKSVYGLEVLRDINASAIKLAKELVKKNGVEINLKEESPLLYIECKITSGLDFAKVIIQNEHTNFCYIEKNGTVILDDSAQNKTNKNSQSDYPELTVERIFKFATSVPFEKISFILEAAIMNKAISDEGLRNCYGMQVGRQCAQNIEKGIFKNDLLTHAICLTAAAADARMDGSAMPVMSNSGSGNQGITATMPIIAIAEKLKSSDEELARALILSHTITIYIKSHLGKLSALCGVMVAATGSSAGIVYLMGGNLKQIEYAIKNMAGGITGMICDGAKVGCALKVAAAVSTAVQTSLLAMNNIGISHFDGIIEKDVDKTIQNVARIGTIGMVETDKLILKTMIEK